MPKHHADQIQREELPAYLQNDLAPQGLFQPLQFNSIRNLMTGQKAGKHIAEPDKKWIEKWFELSCDDMSPADQPTNAPLQAIIVKYVSKFWTNIDLNLIEGESVFQVLSVDHMLLFELKDNFSFENILTKEGSLRSRVKKVKTMVPQTVTGGQGSGLAPHVPPEGTFDSIPGANEPTEPSELVRVVIQSDLRQHDPRGPPRADWLLHPGQPESGEELRQPNPSFGPTETSYQFKTQQQPFNSTSFNDEPFSLKHEPTDTHHESHFGDS